MSGYSGNWNGASHSSRPPLMRSENTWVSAAMKSWKGSGLKRAGIIRKFRARIDQRKVGITANALVAWKPGRRRE